MDEATGRRVLRARFEAAGMHIVEDQRLEIDGHLLIADGYDPELRVGYEYLTREAGDQRAITPPLVAALEAHALAGDVIFFLVDEDDVSGPAELSAIADRFLDTLRRGGRLA